MHIDDLSKRLKEIEDAITKTNGVISLEMANLHMLEGGRRECLHWINKIKKDGENATG